MTGGAIRRFSAVVQGFERLGRVAGQTAQLSMRAQEVKPARRLFVVERGVGPDRRGMAGDTGGWIPLGAVLGLILYSMASNAVTAIGRFEERREVGAGMTARARGVDVGPQELEPTRKRRVVIGGVFPSGWRVTGVAGGQDPKGSEKEAISDPGGHPYGNSTLPKSDIAQWPHSFPVA